MDAKNVKIEMAMVQKFFAEQNPRVSLIILKNEITTAYELSNKIIDLNNNLKERETLNSKRILDYFRDSLKINIQFSYLQFLEDLLGLM